MKGDILVLEECHRRVASAIVPLIIERIRAKTSRYTIAVAGESGSGKSETGRAIADEMANYGSRAIVLGQDDYFVLPPGSNDQKRRADPDWLGPHVEVRLDLMDRHLLDAIQGKAEIIKPLVDYDSNTINEERVCLEGIGVVIAEGTYTSLLKHIDTRIFITRDWRDTLVDRRKRKRGKEVGDPFIEQVLKMEHKIIAGHRHLADFVITHDYDVIAVA